MQPNVRDPCTVWMRRRGRRRPRSRRTLVPLTCVPPGATVNVQQPLHHEPSDAMDDVTRALLILQRSPYTAVRQRNRSGRAVCFSTPSPAKFSSSYGPGLDEQRVTDVLDPKLFQFVRRDVCKIRPARADFEKWMKAV